MPALDGVRILDMTQYEAGTSCTQALAWLGADVVKIEAPEYGDPGRGVGRSANKDYSAYFCAWNANKRSLALDLRTEKGRDLLLRLVPRFDVFVENYGPGVTERLDIGYDALSAVHPGVIYARVKGFGASGPYAGFRSMDMVAQAAAGAFSITGEEDGPPLRPGPTTGDAGTGVQMALAIVAAHVQRLNTGKGQLIELSMQEAMTYYLRTATASGRFGERAVGRSGNGALPSMTLYPCKGDGPNDYVYIMAVTDRMWGTLCRLIGRQDLYDDPAYKDPRDRYRKRDVLKGEIAKWTSERDKYDAMRELAEGGVPASAVLDTSDLYRNPHLVERGFVHELEHPTVGPIKLLGWPARMSESQVPIKAAPLLGANSREVLAADLGLAGEEIDELVGAGVIGKET